MKKVIIDTSVWIENEKIPVTVLHELLREGRAILHRAVLGELAVGVIRNRRAFLSDLRLLKMCNEKNLTEVIELIEGEKLFGRGLSLVDCMIMASAQAENLLIFSFDKKLNTFQR